MSNASPDQVIVPPLSRSALLRVPLGVGALVVGVTESLGALGWIAPAPVAITWLLVAAFAFWLTRRNSAAEGAQPIDALAPRAASLAWAAVGGLLLVTLVTGMVSAPNAWDAVTYHLPRVERWVEQGHLGFWPTPTDRQLWMLPWSSYVMLQLRLLTGGDLLAFLPSWLAYVGCTVLTAHLVRRLGGNPRQAASGALLMASIPVAALHASSVQTDLPAAFWVLCVIVLSIEAWREPAAARDQWHLIWLAIAVGLATATKATTVFAMVPWLLLYAVSVYRAAGARAVTRSLFAGAFAVALMTGPTLARNVATFDTPLGPAWAANMLRLSPITPNGALANALGNLTLHAWSPWPAWNDRVTSSALWVQGTVLRADPEALFPFHEGFRVHRFRAHESEVGMPIHLLALLGVLGSMAWARPRSAAAGTLPLLLVGVAAFLLHLALVRWQPFGARLQLGSMIWLPALVPLLLPRFAAARIVGAAAVLFVLPVLLFAAPRPLIGPQSAFTTTRSEQFAIERPDFYAAVEGAVLLAGLNRCTVLGVLGGFDFPEYYLTAVRARENLPLRWEHLNSSGPPSRLSGRGAPPGVCALLVAQPMLETDIGAFREGFMPVWAEPPFEILLRTAEGDR